MLSESVKGFLVRPKVFKKIPKVCKTGPGIRDMCALGLSAGAASRAPPAEALSGSCKRGAPDQERRGAGTACERLALEGVIGWPEENAVFQ